jgi:SIR2-like protein
VGEQQAPNQTEGPIWQLRRPVAESVPRSNGLWSGQAIERGAVLPIISNYVLPRTFGVDMPTVARAWAQSMESPLSDEDNSDLTRVAQYFGIAEATFVKARDRYLAVLKELLLNLAEHNGTADQRYIDQLRRTGELDQSSFTKLATRLDYPRLEQPERGPMRLLAEMPLPIYLTTSQHEFLEVELANTYHKDPVSEIFYWDDSLRVIESIYDREPNYKPSVQRPLVYHLFGVDRHPDSIVVSEYDHLSTLMTLAELKRNTRVADYGSVGPSGSKFDLPSELKYALACSGLLMLGYNVASWEFRVLFRWLVRYIVPSRTRGEVLDAFAIQLEPGADQLDPKTQALKRYVTEIFDHLNFTVYWGDADACVNELWNQWKGAAT